MFLRLFLFSIILFNLTGCGFDRPGLPTPVVGVFGSADEKIAPAYKKMVHEIGQSIARHKWGLVTGGGGTGLMKSVIDGYMSVPSGYPPVGILPSFMHGLDIHHQRVPPTHLFWTSSMHERLGLFHHWCDVILVMPGGFGTLHELMDMLVHNQFGLVKKKIILFNIDHYYDDLVAQYRHMVRQKALSPRHLDHLTVVNTLGDLIAAIKTPMANLHQGFDDHYWK